MWDKVKNRSILNKILPRIYFHTLYLYPHLLNSVNFSSDLMTMEISNLKEKNIDLTNLIADLKNNKNEIIKNIQNLNVDNKNLELKIRELLATLSATKVKLNKAEEEIELSEAAKNQVTILNIQVADLREQLAAIESLLDIRREELKKKDVQIAELGKKLNTALAVKVGELTKYKSEFFGRLREILGNRKDVQIVGDRFIFQSEVLFESGSADIGVNGINELNQLSKILIDITDKIPSDIPWVLQIQGHTDQNPISTVLYPSNWELSSARAISVGRVLISSGINPNKISVAGFAEFQPLSVGNDQETLRKNRRIEIKLTQP